MRTALYCRVSTPAQDPNTQLDQLRAYAESAHLPVVAEYIETASGAQDDRPALKQLLEDARRRRYDLLVFWSLDRISRGGIARTLEILQRLQDHGVQFRSLTQPQLDTTGPLGEMMIAIFAALAQVERQVMLERTRAGLARARAQGKQLGRPRRIISLDRIGEMRQAGASTAEVARRLQVSAATVRRRLTAAAAKIG